MIFVEIFHDFGCFFATRIRFIEAGPDPDPADQIETDPNGSATLHSTFKYFPNELSILPQPKQKHHEEMFTCPHEVVHLIPSVALLGVVVHLGVRVQMQHGLVTLNTTSVGTRYRVFLYYSSYLHKLKVRLSEAKNLIYLLPRSENNVTDTLCNHRLCGNSCFTCLAGCFGLG